MPPITALTRIEPIHLDRLEKQGIFTTGLLLEVSETRTRRQTLADQVDADTTDVLAWRDEALLLNLARFGPAEHALFIQARVDGLRRPHEHRARRPGGPARERRDAAQAAVRRTTRRSRCGGTRRRRSATE